VIAVDVNGVFPFEQGKKVVPGRGDKSIKGSFKSFPEVAIKQYLVGIRNERVKYVVLFLVKLISQMCV
jgi:hypothetical protein